MALRAVIGGVWAKRIHFSPCNPCNGSQSEPFRVIRVILAQRSQAVTDAQVALLQVALRNSIIEPNIEAGYARFHTLDADVLGYVEFCEAIASCLREDLIREPIRLPAGALQCHWHLELTPKGVEAARATSGFRG